MTTNRSRAGQNRHVSTSKFLSLVLRHQPGLIGLELDEAGWTLVNELLAKCAAAGHALSHEALEEIVRTSDKQRFAFSEDGTRIRANQGHSIPVDLGLPPLEPPTVLLHGTTKRFLPSILAQGLAKRARHHVHLSESASTATAVGARRGESVLLKVDAARMHAEGHLFYRSANGVWLTDAVPAQYLSPLITLYRPTGPRELALVEASGFKRWPPRLPDQPIFYPVTNEDYAVEIARDWNVQASGEGFVTRFEVEQTFMQRYPIHTVGAGRHTEWWVPAEELEQLNDHIVGAIEVIHRFAKEQE
jgi:putative RNA 2'-phosphotransferase